MEGDCADAGPATARGTIGSEVPAGAAMTLPPQRRAHTPIATIKRTVFVNPASPDSEGLRRGPGLSIATETGPGPARMSEHTPARNNCGADATSSVAWSRQFARILALLHRKSSSRSCFPRDADAVSGRRVVLLRPESPFHPAGLPRWSPQSIASYFKVPGSAASESDGCLRA